MYRICTAEHEDDEVDCRGEMSMKQLCWITGLLLGLFPTPATAASLPGAYFPLLEAGAAQVEERLNTLPNADLKSLETDSRWRHFPYAIVAPAVLYTKKHPQNSRYHDPKMLALALRIGDLLASEHEKGLYEPRGDSDWDTGLWLEAYRLLERELGEERRARWQRAIEENVAPLVSDATERLDFPWYNSPYIGTSPNHYSLWAALLHLSGKTFGKPDWEQLGKKILRRYALVEQTPDGYWGEHSRSGPTTGYNHLDLYGAGNLLREQQRPGCFAGPAPRNRVSHELHLPGWHSGRGDQRSQSTLGRERLGTFRVLQFSRWPPFRRIPNRLLQPAEAQPGHLGTAGSRCALLPRRTRRSRSRKISLATATG